MKKKDLNENAIKLLKVAAQAYSIEFEYALKSIDFEKKASKWNEANYVL